ncbi:hypothetical protein BXT84_15775 [Sulfobacillus thermotolerans]|uniref:Pyrrolo-quinoline quinone repeat domain-containing protein n=1 Tax=Sulfobacillus thermotolerans TaxID=338644 RepID=A0ABM6RUU7_9FIRM|nr:hypothetical protein BXT84_15775 [Sulfobacillus thermotolerans]
MSVSRVLHKSSFRTGAMLAVLFIVAVTVKWTVLSTAGQIFGNYGLQSAKMFGIDASRTPKPNVLQQSLAVHWRYDGGAVMNPVAVRGVVYGGTVSSPFEVVALNIKNGHPLWATPVNNQVMTMPLVIGNRVFVGKGNSLFPEVPQIGQANIRGTGSSSVMALSAKTGQVLWQVPTQGEDMPTPVYWQGDLYVVGGSDQLMEISPVTGQILRTLPIPSYVSMSSPVVSQGVLYFGGAYPYTFYAVNLRTWRVQWQTPVSGATGALDDCPPLLVGHNIYTEAVKTVDGRNTFYAIDIDKATGHIRWQHALGTGPLPYSASGRASNESGIPTFHAGVLYLGSPITKTLYALNARTGAVLWSNGLNHKGITQAPLYVQGQLLVGDSQGTLWDVNAKTGDVLHQTAVGGAFMPSVPLLVGQTVIVGTRAPSLTALPLKAIAPILGGH